MFDKLCGRPSPRSFGLSGTSQQYFFSQNKPATTNQSAVLFLSEQISTSHQPPAKRAVLGYDSFLEKGIYF
jgi:hypothetical protein